MKKLIIITLLLSSGMFLQTKPYLTEEIMNASAGSIIGAIAGIETYTRVKIANSEQLQIWFNKTNPNMHKFFLNRSRLFPWQIGAAIGISTYVCLKFYDQSEIKKQKIKA